MEKQNWSKAKTPLRDQVKISGIIAPDQPLPSARWYGQHGNRYGLCNRLRAWAAIGAAADVHGFNFAVRWERNRACDSVFYDVFVPDTCAIIDCPEAAQKIETIRLFSTGLCGRTASWFCRKLMHNQRRDEFWNARTRRARELRLQPELEEMLVSFLRAIPEDTIGVHVRRTDHPRCNRAGSDQRLVKRMKDFVKRNKNQQFLVCADNPDSVRMLQREFRNRIIWREQTMCTEQLRCSSVADAAIDLYALAHMSKILGNSRSSFCGYAAMLGYGRVVNVR